MARTNHVEGFVIRGIDLNQAEGKITLNMVTDRPGICARIFRELAERDINVNLIVQNSRPDGTAFVTFTVSRGALEEARQACEAIQDEVGASCVEADPNIATISVVGIGMRSHTAVASRAFAALAGSNINIDMISTSEIEIECVVQGDQADQALDALKAEFREEID